MEYIKRGKNKFYIGEDSESNLAELTFVLDCNGNIAINRVYVCENMRGQGIALELVKRIVEYAREEKRKIVPICSYAKAVLTRSSQYEDVLWKQSGSCGINSGY